MKPLRIEEKPSGLHDPTSSTPLTWVLGLGTWHFAVGISDKRVVCEIAVAIACRTAGLAFPLVCQARSCAVGAWFRTPSQMLLLRCKVQGLKGSRQTDCCGRSLQYVEIPRLTGCNDMKPRSKRTRSRDNPSIRKPT